MLAETAYQVIEALNEKEKSRLYAMLGVQSAFKNNMNTSSKKKPYFQMQQQRNIYLEN